jgi:hypothetical protein
LEEEEEELNSMTSNCITGICSPPLKLFTIVEQPTEKKGYNQSATH